MHHRIQFMDLLRLARLVVQISLTICTNYRTAVGYITRRHKYKGKEVIIIIQWKKMTRSQGWLRSSARSRSLTQWTPRCLDLLTCSRSHLQARLASLEVRMNTWAYQPLLYPPVSPQASLTIYAEQSFGLSVRPWPPLTYLARRIISASPIGDCSILHLSQILWPFISFRISY